MEVNTVCMSLEDYTALIKDNQRMHRDIYEKDKVLDAVLDLIHNKMDECIENKRHLEWANVEMEDLMWAMRLDIPKLCNTVKNAIKEREDMEGYQE